MTDGSKIEVDAVLLCTGYHYDFPFLSQECNVEVQGRVVQPLYKHMLHPDHPTIAFIGIPTLVRCFEKNVIFFFVQVITIFRTI